MAHAASIVQKIPLQSYGRILGTSKGPPSHFESPSFKHTKCFTRGEMEGSYSVGSKSQFGLFHKILQKNPNEIFGQPNIWPSSNHPDLKTQLQPHPVPSTGPRFAHSSVNFPLPSRNPSLFDFSPSFSLALSYQHRRVTFPSMCPEKSRSSSVPFQLLPDVSQPLKLEKPHPWTCHPLYFS